MKYQPGDIVAFDYMFSNRIYLVYAIKKRRYHYIDLYDSSTMTWNELGFEQISRLITDMFRKEL